MRSQQRTRRFRAVVFDAVGTIIDPEPPAPVVYARIGRRFGSRLDIAEVARRFRKRFAEEDQLDRLGGLRTSEAREHQRWRRIVARVFDDVPDPEACFRQLFEHFGRPQAWRCDPDAEHVLQAFAGAGLQLGLASNFDARLRRVVAGIPALRPIKHLVISSEVGWKKPASGFFAALAARIALPPAEILFVGDDLANDYYGARSAGLQPVLLARTAAATESPALVHSIRSLAGLLNLLPARDL